MPLVFPIPRCALARVHARIAHQRQAWQWQLAHERCATYDTISLENLELRGMQAMWGRKVTDLGFGRFVQILHQAAEKHGVHVHYIDRFVPCVCDGRAAPAYRGRVPRHCVGGGAAASRGPFPSTKRCHVCGFIHHAITLRERLWTCPCCGTPHQRDRNAATNIYQEGLRPAPTQSRQGASSCERGGCKTRQRAATV